MADRTIIEFNHTGDVLPVVEAWAKQNGYKLNGNEGTARVFKKGTGFLVAPMLLSIEASSGRVRLQAWVRFNLLARMQTLFMLPKEMSIESGGFRGSIPKKMARTAVNKLLGQLGQPEIP